MPIDFEYSNECKNLSGFSEKRTKNSSYKILENFLDLKDHSSILYFTHEPKSYLNWPHAPAQFFPLKCPYSDLKIQFPDLYKLTQNKANKEFLFHFTRIVTEGDETKKINYIAHEFQHAIQYIKHQKIYYYCIIIEYFLCKNLDKKQRLIVKVKLPHEYNALRHAKIVAISLCGKEGMSEFVKQMLNNPEFPDDEPLWNQINSIDVKKRYNLKKEALNLWTFHKIEQKIEALKMKQKICCNDRIIIKMYDHANLND